MASSWFRRARKAPRKTASALDLTLPPFDFEEVREGMATTTTTSPSSHHPHHHNSSGMATSQRKASGPLARDAALPPLPSAPADTPPSVPASWRTNPHSSSPTKTSKYVERVTAENERLTRELKAERLAREEEGRRVGAAQAKAEDTRAETQRLQVLVDTNSRAIERKDRKIEELTAALAAERTRREAAEQRERDTFRLLDEERAEAKKQLALAKEMQMFAESQSNTTRDGFKRVTDGFKARVQFLNQEFAKLLEDRRNQADLVRRQTVIMDQMKVELTNIQRSERNMRETFEKYKAEHEAQIDELSKEVRELRVAIPQREAQAAALVTDMEETRDKMKWVMSNLKRQGNN